MNFKDWAPLKFVDSKLLSQVRLAYVFGKTGQEAFIITKNDEVFACGPNYSHCLGLEKKGPQIEPIIVPQLCHKNVKGFSCSVHDDGAFIFAYTSDETSSPYFWGKYPRSNTFYKNPAAFPMKKYCAKVLEGVAGPNHCLILTSDGQIISFGFNDYGQLGRSCPDLAPGLIEGDLKGKTVTKVSCGEHFSVAVLDNGEVYAWGTNCEGQMGIENGFEDLKMPNKVSALTNVTIENIVCGKSYVLAISNMGELYSWGQNNVGQLGLGDTTSRSKPEKVKKLGKVIDVAATAYGSTSAAMNENSEVYMWGACSEINLIEPTKTQFDTLFDVFAYFANPRIMHRPLLRSHQPDSFLESMRNAFDDPETSDLTIVADKKEILVHKVILMLRSDYFKILLQKPWLEEDKKVLNIDQNYEGLRAYLQYLYSGNFKGTPEVALESLKIGHEYHDLAWKKICEDHVKRGITVENVAYLYRVSLKLDTEDLAKHCVLFAGKHIGDMMDTSGFAEWDANTDKQFMRDCHKQGLFKN